MLIITSYHPQSHLIRLVIYPHVPFPRKPMAIHSLSYHYHRWNNPIFGLAYDVHIRCIMGRYDTMPSWGLSKKLNDIHIPHEWSVSITFRTNSHVHNDLSLSYSGIHCQHRDDDLTRPQGEENIRGWNLAPVWLLRLVPHSNFLLAKFRKDIQDSRYNSPWYWMVSAHTKESNGYLLFLATSSSNFIPPQLSIPVLSILLSHPTNFITAIDQYLNATPVTSGQYHLSSPHLHWHIWG